jgi:hypothetical protein
MDDPLKSLEDRAVDLTIICYEIAKQIESLIRNGDTNTKKFKSLKAEFMSSMREKNKTITTHTGFCLFLDVDPMEYARLFAGRFEPGYLTKSIELTSRLWIFFEEDKTRQCEVLH